VHIEDSVLTNTLFYWLKTIPVSELLGSEIVEVNNINEIAIQLYA